MADVFGSSRVKSLLSSSLEEVLAVLPSYSESIEVLPPNLKDRFLHLMTKRGLVSDENASRVLHRNVKTIDLSESDIGDRCLETIAVMCPNLGKIDLNSTKQNRTTISTAGVVTIAENCRQLQVVYLRRCLELTDEAVIRLSECCQHLRVLNIGGCPNISDRSLVALGQNSAHLRSLNFGHANVTDDGVFSLVNGAPSNTIKELHMNGCKNVTDESIEAVVQFCPNITILLFHGCPSLTDRSRVALEELMSRQEKVKQVTWTIY